MDKMAVISICDSKSSSHGSNRDCNAVAASSAGSQESEFSSFPHAVPTAKERPKKLPIRSNKRKLSQTTLSSPPPPLIPTRYNRTAAKVVPPSQSSKPNITTTVVRITPRPAALQINYSAAGSGVRQMEQHPRGTLDLLSQMEANAPAPMQVPRENPSIETLAEWAASLRLGNGRRRRRRRWNVD